jgi:hypothetical protein
MESEASGDSLRRLKYGDNLIFKEIIEILLGVEPVEHKLYLMIRNKVGRDIMMTQ